MGPTESWRYERLTVVTLLPFRNAEVVVGTASHHCFGTDNEVSGPPLDGLPVRQQAAATHTKLGLPTRLLRNDLGTLVAVRAHFPYVAGAGARWWRLLAASGVEGEAATSVQAPASASAGS